MSTNSVRYWISFARAATPFGLMPLTSGDNGSDYRVRKLSAHKSTSKNLTSIIVAA